MPPRKQERLERATTCAVSGKPLVPGDVFFVARGKVQGVKAGIWRSLSADERQAVRSKLAQGHQEAATAVVDEAQASEGED